MKSRFLLLIATGILLAALLQPAGAFAAAGRVLPADRISIAQPRYSGQWKGYDLSVDYSYSKNQGRMDLSGEIRFANFWMLGYAWLGDFYLGVIFLNENGVVLQQAGLATDRGSFGSISFRRRITLPPNAAYMAFNYQGTAVLTDGGGGGGTFPFWFYPVH